MENLNVDMYVNRYEYTQEFKENIILQILYQGKSINQMVEEYSLPDTQTVQAWIRQFHKQLHNGMIHLPPMTKEQKANLKAAENRIKELETALEYSNTVIFSLNHLLDFAEKECSISIRKKGGTKQ